MRMKWLCSSSPLMMTLTTTPTAPHSQRNGPHTQSIPTTTDHVGDGASGERRQEVDPEVHKKQGYKERVRQVDLGRFEETGLSKE